MRATLPLALIAVVACSSGPLSRDGWASASETSLRGSPARSVTLTALREGQAEDSDAAGARALCLANSKYVTSFVQRFNDLDSWRVTNGGRWYTSYPWGTSNSGAHDAAFYIDKADQIGHPSYDPFRLTPGHTLAIRAQPVAAVPGASAAQVDGYEYVSGMISTSGQNAVGKPATSFAQRYGYYEVAAQLPKGQGLWPSFWMLDDYGLTAEIDVFELLGNDPEAIYQSVHYRDGTGHSYKTPLDFDPTTAMHRYGVLVSPSEDTYFIDGKSTRSVRDASVNPLYFMVSLQVGGPDSWPGPPDENAKWPAEIDLQYFHAYAPTGQPC